MIVVGLDIGRHSVKVAAPGKLFSFRSLLGEWRERNLKNKPRPDDLEIEFEGRRYFGGSLAEDESAFVTTMMTDEKDHEHTLILALVALHRAEIHHAAVVTGLPVALHDDERKERMRKLLRGVWNITVNGVRRTIVIDRVEVAVEGGGAFWSQPTDGLVRIIDAGAKTTNYVTMRDRRYIDRDSGTLSEGCETAKTGDIDRFAAYIAGQVGRRWKQTDRVWVCGGMAEELAARLRTYFPRAEAMSKAQFANALGFYNAGKLVIGCST